MVCCFGTGLGCVLNKVISSNYWNELIFTRFIIFYCIYNFLLELIFIRFIIFLFLRIGLYISNKVTLSNY